MMRVSLNMAGRIVQYLLAIISPLRNKFPPVTMMVLNPEWQNVLWALSSARDVVEDRLVNNERNQIGS